MIRVLFPLLLLVLLMGCERRTTVRFEVGNPPTFVLSGSGRLDELIIFGPEQERLAHTDPFDETYSIWKIGGEERGEAGMALVEDLHAITYGVVPKGYKQIKPEKGTAPQLIPGTRYGYWFVTVNAPWGAGYFEIRNGKAVPVEGP